MAQLQAGEKRAVELLRDNAVTAAAADGLRAQLAGWREDKDASLVRWVEVFHQSVQFNATPLSIAEIFRKQVEAQAKAWVFTSATLSVNGNFSHYVNELGIESAQTESWASPFDFANQGLLYVPQQLQMQVG